MFTLELTAGAVFAWGVATGIVVAAIALVGIAVIYSKKK